jgi:predicted permease
MLVIAPRTVLRALLTCSVLLIAAFLATQTLHWQISKFKLGYLTTLLNADGEQSLPTWFSSGLLLLSGALCALVAWGLRRARERDVWHWAGLALIFLVLSLDEQAAMHEQLNRLRELLDTGGVLYFAWVLPAALGLLLFGALYLRFWLRLPARTRWLLALAGVVYVGGALGVEVVGAALYEIDRKSTAYLIAAAVEELCEMLGLAILVYTLLCHIRDYLPGVAVAFAPAAAPAERAAPARRAAGSAD